MLRAAENAEQIHEIANIKNVDTAQSSTQLPVKWIAWLKNESYKYAFCVCIQFGTQIAMMLVEFFIHLCVV